jgi:hypothetical protein
MALVSRFDLVCVKQELVIVCAVIPIREGATMIAVPQDLFVGALFE